MEYILMAAVALIVFILFFLFIKVEKLRNRANALFLEAEKNVTKEKFNYVCVNLYEYTPTILKILLSEEDFKNLVQMIYDRTRKTAKDLLSDGKLNGK